MDQRLGPSRIGDVLQPFLLAGILLATASAAGLLLTYDPSRAATTIGNVFVFLLFPSIFLISPYMISIGAQGIGNTAFPLLGVRAAAAGCAGFAAMIGLAMARPLDPLAGFLGVAAGLGLIALQVGLRRRSRRAS